MGFFMFSRSFRRRNVNKTESFPNYIIYNLNLKTVTGKTTNKKQASEQTKGGKKRSC